MFMGRTLLKVSHILFTYIDNDGDSNVCAIWTSIFLLIPLNENLSKAHVVIKMLEIPRKFHFASSMDAYYHFM